MQAKIKIDGIAICYFDAKTKAHKVIFPFDEHHVVFIKKDDAPQRVLAAKKRKVEINAQPPEDSIPFSPENIKEFLDITSSYSHSAGIKPVTGWDDSAVHLTLSNATFVREDLTKCNFGLYEKKENEIEQKLAPRRIIYNGSYVITAERSIEISISGRAIRDYESPVTLTDGSTVTISNRCEQCLKSDQDADFRMIYEVIEDAAGNKKQFKMDRQNDQKPPQPVREFISDKTKIKIIEFLARLLKFPILVGIFNNPEIRKEGLPCNIVGASDSKHLP